MRTEEEQMFDQYYSVGNPVLPTARELLLEAREYVARKAIERDQFALATLAKIDKFLA